MTISTENRTNNYVGNGSIVTYPYTYLLLFSTDIEVYLDDVLQVTGYTVTNVTNDSGGNIVFDIAPANGVAIFFQRVVPITQLTDYEEYDPFSATDHENALDKLTMIDMQQQDEIDRSLKVDIGETVPVLDLTDAAGKVLEVTSNGEKIVGNTSAADLLQAEIDAENAAAAALISATNAANSETHAYNWATRAEDNIYNDGVNPENYSAFHYMKKAQEIIATGVEVIMGEVDVSVDLLTDFNAMDWTGHPNSGSPVTAMYLPENSIAVFAYDGDLYTWFGPKDVTVGLGGTHTAIATDLVLRTANSAAATTFNPNTTDLTATNVQDAIEEVVDVSIPTAISALGSIGKNILINGDFRVDQRGNWGGDWSNIADGDFGPDRWTHEGTNIRQLVDAINTVENDQYILSWEGGGDGAFTANTGGQGPSPVSGRIDYTGAGLDYTIVTVPDNATNIQLERASNVTQSTASPFEVRHIQQEIALCQRYYNPDLMLGAANYVDSAVAAGVRLSVQYPVPTRIIPTVTWSTTASGNTVGTPVQISLSETSLVYDVASAGQGRVVWNGTVTLEAEITA